MLAFAVFAGACSSDDSSTAGSDSSDSAEGGSEAESGGETDAENTDTDTEPAAGSIACGLGNGEAASGDPIKLGGIVGETGPDDFSSSGDAAAAYFDCVNANGGINGRPIEYLVEDDQWNPEVAGQAAARLVQDEGVVAMVGGASFVECGVNAELYASEGLISVPGVGVPRQCFEASNIVPVNEGPRLSTLGVAQYLAAEKGATSFVCMQNAIPGLGDWVCEGVEAWATAEGHTVTTQLIDPTIPDPTAVALDALSVGADVILISLSAGAATPILAAAEQQDAGDAALWAGPTSLYDVDFPSAIGSYWSDRLWVQIEFNVLDSTEPDNQEWLAIMDGFGSDDDPRDSFSQAGYLSAKFVTNALLGVEDPASIDRAVATEAITAAQDESDLLCGPWYAGPGDTHNANHAGRVVAVSDDGYATLVDCTEVADEALAPILVTEAELGIGG